MREDKPNSKLIIILGFVMTMSFSIIWLIEEWGVWQIQTVDHILFGFILILLGMIVSLINKVEELTK